MEKGRRKGGEGKMSRKRKSDMMNENEELDIDQRRNDTKHRWHVNVRKHTNIRRHYTSAKLHRSPIKESHIDTSEGDGSKSVSGDTQTFWHHQTRKRKRGAKRKARGLVSPGRSDTRKTGGGKRVAVWVENTQEEEEEEEEQRKWRRPQEVSLESAPVCRFLTAKANQRKKEKNHDGRTRWWWWGWHFLVQTHPTHAHLLRVRVRQRRRRGGRGGGGERRLGHTFVGGANQNREGWGGVSITRPYLSLAIGKRDITI